MTVIGGLLATAVLLGLIFNAAVGWWWTGRGTALAIGYLSPREGSHALQESVG